MWTYIRSQILSEVDTSHEFKVQAVEDLTSTAGLGFFLIQNYVHLNPRVFFLT